MWWALVAAIAGEPVTWVSLGDSFTIGTGVGEASAWPTLLASAWRTKGCAVTLHNPARNGFTTDDVLREELAVVVATQPTWVTLAIGANDLVRGGTVDRYRAQLGRIFDALAAAGVPASAVVTLPQPDWSASPVGVQFGEPAALRASIEAYNTTLAEVSAARGARFFDLRPLQRRQADAGLVAKDGLHPSAEAHAAWAAAIGEAVACPAR